MNNPLIITDEFDKEIRDLCEFATAQPVDMAGLMERLNTKEGKAAHMAQMSRQTIRIPMGFLVTFSIEHNHPCGACRHMSVSVEREGRVPSEDAVWLLALRFGFVSGFKHCHVWLEDLRGHGKAVNVLQPLDYEP